MRERLEAVVDVGELREQHVERAAVSAAIITKRAGPHADEALERRWLLTGDLGDLGAELLQERLRRLLARRGGERERLEVRRGGGEVVAAQTPGGRRDDRLGADDRGQRRQQLGAVDRLEPRRRRLLAEAEVDDDRPLVGDEDVRGAEATGARAERGA